MGELPGDIAVRMCGYWPDRGLVFECVTCFYWFFWAIFHGPDRRKVSHTIANTGKWLRKKWQSSLMYVFVDYSGADPGISERGGCTLPK